MTSNRKSAPNEEALRRVLSPALAREAADRAITPEFKEAAEKVRKHGSLKTGQDLLGWDAFIDRTSPPPAAGEVTIPDRRNPVVPVPEALLQKKRETEEALRRVAPGSDAALVIIREAAEAGVDPTSLEIDVDAIDRVLRVKTDADATLFDPNPTLVDVPTTTEAPDATLLDAPIVKEAPAEAPRDEAPQEAKASEKPSDAPAKPLAMLQPHLKIGPSPSRELPDVDAIAYQPPTMSGRYLVLGILLLLAGGAAIWWWLSSAPPPPEPITVPTYQVNGQETAAPPVTAPPRDTARPIESVVPQPSVSATAVPTASARTSNPPGASSAGKAPPSPSGTPATPPTSTTGSFSVGEWDPTAPPKKK